MNASKYELRRQENIPNPTLSEFLETLGFEGESQPISYALRASGTLSLSRDASPPRMTRKSYGPQVPNGTMVGT
jgi:hypothetical protein